MASIDYLLSGRRGLGYALQSPEDIVESVGKPKIETENKSRAEQCSKPSSAVTPRALASLAAQAAPSGDGH